MNVLNLIIKQKFFDEILAGKKTEEYREIRPTTMKKYCQFEINGEIYDSLDDFDLESVPEGTDITFEMVPKQYDALRLYVGYNKDRDSALVEVKECIREDFVDEDDNLIYYEHKGVTYHMCQMVYVLGKVLEKDIHQKK